MNLVQQKPHVFWARLMMSQILKNNAQTTYRHSTGPIFWGPYDKQPGYICISDCSGFINALLRRSYNLKTGWMGRERPYSSTYYNQIVNGENGFQNIKNINDANTGDFIVFRIPPGQSRDTGHIMLINSPPKLMMNNQPIIANTLQWQVEIIDLTGTPHGHLDTRYANRKSGLGIGHFRIYTDTNGILQGYSWGPDNNSKYIDMSDRPVVIGRLNLGANY